MPPKTETKWGISFGRPDLERIGLFAEMPYMNGKGYVSPFARDKKSKDLKSFVCPGNKTLCGNQDGLFEREFKRIFEKEAIVRGNKPPKAKNMSDRPFISICGSKLQASPGDYYGCFSGNISAFSPTTRPAQKKPAENRPFITNPGKKGGPGYVDITIGKYPTYMWSKYNAKPIYKQYGRQLDGPMKTVVYPQPYFGPEPYPDPPKMKRGRIYVKPKEKVYGVPIGKGIYIPTGPGKWHSHQKHLLRMGLSDTDECRFCGEEEETPIHLVTECYDTANQRKECLEQETCRSGELSSLKPSQILDFIRSLELEGELCRS